MDQLQQFINQLNGHTGVGDTSVNKGQCVGLIEEWIDDTLHLSHVWGNAMDLLTNADPNVYTIVLNSPTGVPPRGAVLVFGKSFNGTVGHTGIVTRADVNTFELFEQNNPAGAGCRLHTYPNYNYVLGWFFPKTSAANGLPSNYADIISKSSNWDEVVKLGFTSVDSLKQKLNQPCPPQKTYTDQKKRITDALAEIE